MVSWSLNVVKVISPSAYFTISKLLRLQIGITFPQYQRKQSFHYYKREHKLSDNQTLRCNLTSSVCTSRNHIQLTKVENK